MAEAEKLSYIFQHAVPPEIEGQDIMATMTKAMKEAVEEIAALPEADQEAIGRQLLSHVEKLQQLRAEIDKGIGSLDSGQGHELNVSAFIAQANQRHGRR